MGDILLSMQAGIPGTFGPFPAWASGFMILIGLLYCFFGYKVFKVTLFITGAIVGGFIGSLTLQGIFYIILGALIGGFLAMGLYIVGIFILGAILGAGLVLLLFTPVSAAAPAFLLWLFGIVGGILAVIIQRSLIVIASAFCGAAMVVDGFDAIVGGGGAIPVLGEKGLEGITFVHLVLIIVLTIAGMIVQFSTTKEPEKSKVQPTDPPRQPDRATPSK